MLSEEFVFITPTFPPDRGRCELLVESLGHCCPGAKHYLIIDSHDMRHFRHLASVRTELVASEEVVEPWLRRLPTRHGFWISMRTLPVRGWMMQQIRKMAIANILSAPNLIYCDSDMAFIRPFGLSNLLVDGKLGLLDVPYQDDEVRRWTRLARDLLGLREPGGDVRGHVGQMIAWRRDNVLGLQAMISTNCNTSWQRAVARLRTISEYILYGVYVREVLGYSEAMQNPSQAPLVKTSWDSDITTPQGLASFFATFEQQTIAIMAHSKDPIDQVELRRQVERQWRR